MDSEKTCIIPRNSKLTDDPPHVILLHEKLKRRNNDRYILNIGLAFQKIGYKVTLLTSYYDTSESLGDIQFSDKIDIKYSGWWIPRSVFGLFRAAISTVKAAWMATRVALFPPSPKPDIIITDVNLVAILILKFITRYKVFYVETFMPIRTFDVCSEHSMLEPNLLEAKSIKFAHEIIVETEEFAGILKKSFPNLTKTPVILYPSIDIGLWNDPGISVQRIIPDLMENTILFLTVGRFVKSSNFGLTLNAFDQLINLFNDVTITKRFQLIVGGNCRTYEEEIYYNQLLAATKGKMFATQVTFLKHLPIIHEKTLIKTCSIMIHPAKNDAYSPFLLRAMSLNKPIIATNKGIASRLLTDRLSGILVDPDPRVFALAMKKLVTSPHLLLFLGDMAKETFDKSYSFDSFCKNIRHMLYKNETETVEKTPTTTVYKRE